MGSVIAKFRGCSPRSKAAMLDSIGPRRGDRMPRFRQSLMSGLLLVLLLGAWSAPSAVAQQADTPSFLPTSDVAVFYRFDRVPEGGQPHALRITYTKAGERVRLDAYRWVEAKYPYKAVIFDRPA